MNYLKNLTEVNAFDNPSSPLLRMKEFSELLHKTFDSLRKNKEDNDAGWLLLVSSSVDGLMSLGEVSNALTEDVSPPRRSEDLWWTPSLRVSSKRNGNTPQISLNKSNPITSKCH